MDINNFLYRRVVCIKHMSAQTIWIVLTLWLAKKHVVGYVGFTNWPRLGAILRGWDVHLESDIAKVDNGFIGSRRVILDYLVEVGLTSFQENMTFNSLDYRFSLFNTSCDSSSSLNIVNTPCLLPLVSFDFAPRPYTFQRLLHICFFLLSWALTSHGHIQQSKVHLN